MRGIWDELLELLAIVAAPDWRNRAEWGISDSAWSRLLDENEKPENVFCNPSVIQASPRLITYYRCIALLPQKGLQRLATGTQRLEEGKGNLNAARAIAVSRAINSLVSLLIDSDNNWSLEGARSAALLNLGSQINGSWRNEIGTEGGHRVKQLVLALVLENELAASISMADGSQTPPKEIENEQLVRSVNLSNGFTIIFSSEPDIAVRDTAGRLTATVEVKYGLDPAGALERYGAAKKSFEAATHENMRVANVYLASCITPEVRRRIAEDRLVNQEFNLTEVLHTAPRRQEFLNYIRRLLET